MFTVGIDVGSITTKAVLMNGSDWRCVIRPTGCSPRQAGSEAFEELLGQAGLKRDDVTCVVGTGYGRISLPFIDKAVTEITCHARGRTICSRGPIWLWISAARTARSFSRTGGAMLLISP